MALQDLYPPEFQSSRENAKRHFVFGTELEETTIIDLQSNPEAFAMCLRSFGHDAMAHAAGIPILEDAAPGLAGRFMNLVDTTTEYAPDGYPGISMLHSMKDSLMRAVLDNRGEI